MIVKLMMGLLFFSFTCLFKGSDTIPWDAARKLAWADFQGKPDATSFNAALTNSGIEFKYAYNDNKFTYTIICLFDKKKSWGKIKSDYILAHEQAHFDISEIHARKLNQALKTYVFTIVTGPKEIGAIYSRIMKAQTDMQQQYDAETDHSINKKQQQSWLEKINNELEKLNVYADYNKPV